MYYCETELKHIKQIYFLLLFSLIMIPDCKDSVTAGQVDTIVIPSSNVSYIKYIQPVFTTKCINCHNDQVSDGNLSLTSWAGTTLDRSIVFPGSPQTSRLVWSIQAQSGASPMPPPGSAPPLNTNQINGVITWIKEGAKNN